MKKFIMIIGLSSLLLWRLGYAADRNGNYIGYTRSCMQYLEVAAQGQIYKEGGVIYRAWIEGYLTAVDVLVPELIDIKEQFNITTEKVLEDAMMWCIENPDKGFGAAVIRYIKALISSRK